MQLVYNLIALLWPVYQITQLPLDLPIRIYALDILIVIAFFVSVYRYSKQPHVLIKPILIFSSVALLSLLLSKIVRPQLSLLEFLISSLYLFRFLLYAFLLQSTPKIRPYLNFSIFIFVFIGLLQYFLLPDLRFLKASGYDDHYYRLTFPLLDPNFTASFLGFIIVFSIKDIKTRLGQILLIFSVLALSLTFSRSGYASLFFGLIPLSLLLHLPLKKLKPLLILPLLLVALIIISPKPFGEGVNLTRTYSISSRIINIDQGLQLFRKNIITGIGFNTLKFQGISQPVSRASGGITNSYIFILVTTGLLGFLLFVNLITKIIRMTKHDPYYFSGLLVLAGSALFNNTLFFAPITIFIFLSLSVFTDNT